MKKIIVLVSFALCILLVSCGITPVFYKNTSIPTFTCVTGIEASEQRENLYIYSCMGDNCEELAEEYMNYLENEHGFSAGSERAITHYDKVIGTIVIMSKDDQMAMVGTDTEENTVSVMLVER